ncbi:MAG: heat-inducible transcription repressor HrcA [Ignavibacteriales bacterium]|nr:heat-inducible transcription repressor HrcA [Ignavibacteriales bacterium]
MNELNDRERTILHNIVYSYIQTAIPIGSRYISKRKEIGLSPATIRNVMSDLEYWGYLGHPHTSAGRVPTDKGYRFYVDELMEIDRLSDKDQTVIHSQLQGSVQTDEVLKIASKILGTISRQLSVVTAPQMTTGIFEKLELIQLSSTRLLVIISIRSGLVKTLMMEIQSEILRTRLDQVTQFLNERLSGLTLKEIRDSFIDRVRDFQNEESGLIRLFIESVDKLFDEDKKEKIHISGTKSMLSQPEFESTKNFKSVIELMDNEDIIIHVLENKDAKTGLTTVTIGEENKITDLKDFSLITSTYTVGDLTGTIGVLGPKRMAYSKMIPLVDYVAKTISGLFQQSKQ